MTFRKIFIARHGERLDFVDPTWFKSSQTPHDPPLTRSGKTQATELGQKLSTLNIKHVFASPFSRCVNTASNAAKSISPALRVNIEPGLCEWLNALWYRHSEKGPIWRTVDSLAREFDNVDASYDPIYPMSHNFDAFPESLGRLNQRCDKTYRTVLERVQGDGNVLLVGHGSSVDSLIRLLDPAAPEENITSQECDNGSSPCPPGFLAAIIMKLWHAFVPIPPPWRTSRSVIQNRQNSLCPNSAPLFYCVCDPSIAFVLSHFEASNLLKLKKHAEPHPKLIDGPFSVDIGKSHLHSLLLSEDGISLHNANVNSLLKHHSEEVPVVVTWAELKKMSKKGKAGAFECYLDGESAPNKIAGISQTTNRAASLHPCAPGKPPTLILGGFGMHRLKDTDPATDTEAKIHAIGTRYLRGNVLDVCTGLGYTALAAAEQRNVVSVTTVELDPVVVSVQRRNPWSQPLFSHEKITTIEGDAIVVLNTLSESHFNLIIHDPPAQAMGGELYSTAFYHDLRRVCARGALLFHYIGDPTSQESGKLYRGVTSRLSEAGFRDIKKDVAAFGIIAHAS